MCRPVAHELKNCLHDRWVRFHSLPGSKRYADDEAEYAEILRRHVTVLAGLLSGDGPGTDRELLVVMASWSGSELVPDDEAPAGLPAADYWASILTGGVPGEETRTYLRAAALRFPGEELSRLLRLVADDVLAGMIITTADMRWLYHPYDGGADVIAATPAERDQLRSEHPEWLSAHPAGL